MILFFDQIGAPIPYWLVDVRLFGLVDHSSPLSLLLCLACTAILLVGVKESARVNMVITILNVLCILFIVVLGSLHIDSANWVRPDPVARLPATCKGSGTGFFPCGLNGVLTGAAQVSGDSILCQRATRVARTENAIFVCLTSFSVRHTHLCPVFEYLAHSCCPKPRSSSPLSVSTA